ncbi:MAG: Iron-containing alcohol dehydrogenase [Atribacteria bacterium 34_128]|nr:MAG: Iron-containing alcohol dehydrogenase [Atribacteria bacterium 34_128]
MISTTIFPGRYVQGYDALKRLGVEMSRFGQKGFVICDSFVLDHLLPNFLQNIEQAIEIKVERFSGKCSDEEVERLSDLFKKAGCELIVGIGGGKTLDTAKAVAYELKLSVAIVPTIAATDAPCSALSVIYTPDGKFKRYLILPKNPDLVLVDTKIIAQAPVRFLVSGMGDALATWFEAESCKKKYARNMTGDVGSMTAYTLAWLCYETLLEYGVLAKSACKAHIVTPALEHIVEANTLLSGLGFESGGLAAAHAIHNGLTVLEQTHKYYHGEKVAIGTLASLFLTDKPMDIIDEVYSFCESVGLPTTLAEIGLSDVSDEELMKAAKTACVEEETIHNEPIPITPEMVFSALKAAGVEGRRRKGSVK